MAALLAAVGLVLIVAGVAFVFWPAALIVAGAALLGFGLLYDDDDGKAADESR
jgi:hypothetical protein